MKSKLLLATATIAAAALALTGCSGSPDAGTSASSDDPFDFLYVGGITGGQASLSAQEIAAIEVAIEGINDEGGINGRAVELETLDSKSDPTEAVSVLQKRLASGDKPDLVRAGLSSTEALAMLPVTSRAGIPSYTSAGSSLLDDPEAYPYNKALSAKFLRQTEMGRTYVEAKGWKKLVVMAPEDASGDSTVEGVEEVYADSDIQVDVVRYNTADLDLSVAYQRAISTSPDVIYANCLGAPCVRVVSARTSVAEGTDIPMFGDTSMAGSAGGATANVPAEAIENLSIITQSGAVASSDPGEYFTAFYDGLKEELGAVDGIPAPAVAYDGLRMWAYAMNEAGTTDAAKGLAAINDAKFPAGYFVYFGDAVVDYDADSAFPKLPDEAFIVVKALPLEGGVYPAVDEFTP